MKISSLFETIQEPDRSDVRWAIGRNAQQAKGYVRDDLNNPNNVVVQVNIEHIFNNTDVGFRLDINNPVGGRNSVSGRVSKAKSHWGGGGYMNPSIISINSDGAVNFEDGRHRLVAAYQLGHRYAPVIMDQESFNNLQNQDKIKFRTINETVEDDIDIIQDEWDDGTGYYVVKDGEETIGQARMVFLFGNDKPDRFLFQYQSINDTKDGPFLDMSLLKGKNVKEKEFEAKLGPIKFRYDDWVSSGGQDDIVIKLFNRWVKEQILGKSLYD